MPSLSLDVGDAVELAETLQFLAEWLAADDVHLATSLARFVGSTAYDLGQLRVDLERFAFLLAAATGRPCSRTSTSQQQAAHARRPWKRTGLATRRRFSTRCRATPKARSLR